MRQFAVGAAAAALFSFAPLALAGGGQSNLQASGAQLAAPSVEELPAATRNLLATYPGVQMTWSGPNIRGFMGMPMTEGATPQAAVDGFWAAHQDAFGVANLELSLRWANDVSFGRFTVYAYQQLMNGLPVEYSVGRVLVQSGQTYHVVYAAGIFAQPPIDGFLPDAVSADAALASVQTMPEYQGMSIWSAPELVVYAGQEFEMGVGDGRFGAPVRAWKFVGDNGILAARTKRTFFVNAATGQLIASRSEIHHTDVGGTVRGMGSPGTNPDIASNPPAAMAMPEIRVSITGGSTVYGDSNGAFTIPNAGTSAVTVTSSVATGATTGGRWVYVNNVPGAEITASATVTPPGPAALMFNAAPSALNTAQVNAFVHTNLIHNFVTDRSSWAGMDIVMPNNVNIASTCNAYYDGSSINFYQAGGGCSNTAYSSVVTHEYGHGIVNNLGLAQGAFGEGFGDCCSILLYNDPVLGRNFQGSSPVRDYSPGIAEDLYPCAAACGGEVHCCGEILAGFWEDIREQFVAAYGASTGLALVQQLFVDWMQITNGGSGNNSAYPTTVTEILTVDDNDGNISNGTPNYGLICAAASAHALSCPTLALIDFQFPDGLPTTVVPGQPANIRVNVLPLSATPTPGTGTVSYRVGAGSFTTISMAQGSPNQYTATLPAVACPSAINFYFSAGSSGGPASSPSTAPATYYSATATYGTVTVLDDNFDTNLGWTVGPGDTAATGIWTRVDPNGTTTGGVQVQPENDHSATGTMCWVTGQGAVGGAVGSQDVDGGFTRLSTPALDLAGVNGATVEYWRWYSNAAGGAPNADTFRVEISNNNGSTWVALETVGPAGSETNGGWFFRSFRVADFVTPTSTVKLRFTAEDASTASLIEAAVDDFRAYGADCTPPAPCPADLNGDGVVDLGDLTQLLAHFGTASGATHADGDLNGDADVDLDDLTALLSQFGTVCP